VNDVFLTYSAYLTRRGLLVAVGLRKLESAWGFRRASSFLERICLFMWSMISFEQPMTSAYLLFIATFSLKSSNLETEGIILDSIN